MRRLQIRTHILRIIILRHCERVDLVAHTDKKQYQSPNKKSGRHSRCVNVCRSFCLPENRFLGLYLTGKTEPCSDIILPNNPTSFLPNICVWISSRRGRLWVLMTYLSCRFFLSNRSCKEGRSSDKHLCLR